MESIVSCPYCGEDNAIMVDESAGGSQQYMEDCQVCCRPWEVVVTAGADGELDVAVRAVGEC